MSFELVYSDIGKEVRTRAGLVVTLEENNDPDCPHRKTHPFKYECPMAGRRTVRTVRPDGYWTAEEGNKQTSHDIVERAYEPAGIKHWLKPAVAVGSLQNVLRTLPSAAADRKNAPVMTGAIDYFPLAVAEVARISKAGNDQHNPGQPLHWARGKSMDHADCIVRHLIERGTLDSDGQRHA